MTNIIHITSKEHFQQELAHPGVSLVDFYADRCGPCRMLFPSLEQLAKENEEKGIKILKINIDEVPALAEEFDVTTIPTIFFAKGGEMKEGFVGVNPSSFYQEKIDAYLTTKS